MIFFIKIDRRILLLNVSIEEYKKVCFSFLPEVMEKMNSCSSFITENTTTEVNEEFQIEVQFEEIPSTNAANIYFVLFWHLLLLLIMSGCT